MSDSPTDFNPPGIQPNMASDSDLGNKNSPTLKLSSDGNVGQPLTNIETGESGEQEPDHLETIGQMSVEQLDEYFAKHKFPNEAKRLVSQGWTVRERKGKVHLRQRGRGGLERGYNVKSSVELLVALERYGGLKTTEKNRRVNKPPQTMTQTVMQTAIGIPEEPGKPKVIVKEELKAAGDFMRRTTEASQFELGLFHELGRGVRFELESEVKLNEEDRKDPELAAKKFLSLIRSMLALKDNAKILIEKDTAILIARQAIQELGESVMTYKMILTTITASLCADCNNRALITMGLRAFNPPTESQSSLGGE